MIKRILTAAAGAAVIAAAPAFAQQEFIFGINEGVTYRITPHETRDRYRELGELLSRTLKRPVKLVPEDNYVKLRASLDSGAGAPGSCRDWIASFF